MKILSSHMKRRDREFLGERSAICKTCGLTARNQHELDNHIGHAHKDASNSDSIKESVEQKKGPFP
jgi:hypothetical protein